MASRLASKRLSALASVRSANCVVRTAAPSARSFSILSKRTPSTYLAAATRKPQSFVNATSFLSVQNRSYADQVVKVPQMAESLTEGTLKQFTKQIGDFVTRDEEIATIETDKIDVAVNAPASGTILEFYAEEEDTVTVGQDLVKIQLGDAPEGGAAAPATETAKEEPKQAAEPKKEEAAAPKEAPKEEAAPAPKPAAAPAQAQAAAPSIGNAAEFGNRGEQRVKMNRIRLRIAERLKESQNSAASLTTFNEIDMSALMDMRALYKEAVLEKTGVKLGFMSAFSRAVVQAMKDVPAVNASIENNDTIVYRDYVDISVAVATPKGLVTPVVRNVEGLDMVEIESAIAGLGQKARDGKLTLEDMAGGTFTISNGGVFGSLFGTPIINLPQTAVLGLHSIKKKPVAIDGKVEIRPIMVVALTYDHRLLDGKEAVTFLVKVKNYIEDPRRLLLGV